MNERLKVHFSDLLFSVEVAGSGEEAREGVFLYLLFEHKSWVDVRARLQLLVGMVQAWERWYRHRPSGEQPVRLPFILPFVLYHGARGWMVSTEFSDFVKIPECLRGDLEKHVVKFEHVLVDLHAMPMEEIRGTAMVRLILGLLKAVSEGREKEWTEKVLTPAADILTRKDAVDFIRAMFEYLVRASDNVSPSTFREWADNLTDETTRKAIMTLAERFIEEGRQEGWQKGEQEGWRKGHRVAILELVELRFGVAPEEVRTKLNLLQTDADLREALRAGSHATSYGHFLQLISGR